MPYLYHAQPPGMRGHLIHPLSSLRRYHPSAYWRQFAKYMGRRRLMKYRLPFLHNCLWNDIVFLIAVHPTVLYDAYEEAGFKRPRGKVYQFDINTLDQSQIVVLTEMAMNAPDVFERFSLGRYGDYAQIPDTTREYWQTSALRRPFLWFQIPHILYRGSLDTRKARLIRP